MKILANNGITNNAEIALQEAGYEVITTKVAQEQLENYINEHSIDAILVNNTTQIQQELIDACPSLKLIGKGGVAMDNIDVQYAIDQGLHIINTPEALANGVAELVFAHLLGMVRNLHQSNREMPLEGDMNFKGLHKLYKGIELRGKTLGIIGMDSSGIATAKIALGLGMNVVMSNPEPKEVTIEFEFFDGQTLHFDFNSIALDELLTESDFISLHIQHQEGFVLSEKEFKKMKDNVCIVNCAFGGLVDEIALVKAFETNKVKYAALDVFENEPKPEIQLLMNPNLSLSPNIGAATEEAQSRISMALANQIIALFS